MSASAVIIKKGDKILLSKRSMNLSEEPGKWENIGGSVDGDESFETAIKREANEELGIELKNLEIELEYKGRDGKVNVVLFSANIEGNPEIKEPDACDEIRWFEIGEVNSLDLAGFTRKDFEILGYLK